MATEVLPDTSPFDSISDIPIPVVANTPDIIFIGNESHIIYSIQDRIIIALFNIISDLNNVGESADYKDSFIRTVEDSLIHRGK